MQPYHHDHIHPYNITICIKCMQGAGTYVTSISPFNMCRYCGYCTYIFCNKVAVRSNIKDGII